MVSRVPDSMVVQVRVCTVSGMVEIQRVAS